MMDRTRPRAWLPSTLILAGSLALSGSFARAQSGIQARWVGQDGHDLVGGEPGPAKNDFQDIRIAVRGLPAGRELRDVMIRGNGEGEWKTQNKDRFTIAVVRGPRSSTADLFIEPYRRETGRSFDLHLAFETGPPVVVSFAGGKADPNLRMPGAGAEAKWVGPSGEDRTGPGVSVGPDGFEDLKLTLARLPAKLEVESVELQGPGGVAWRSGLNPQAVGDALFVRDAKDPTRGDLWFSPGHRDLSGASLKVQVHYANERTDATSLQAGRAGTPRPTPPVAVPNLVESKATVRWLGQDGLDTGLGDVHLVVEGLPTGRSIVAAALSDGVSGTWVTQTDGKPGLDAGPVVERLLTRKSGPGRLDLAFAPIRDETGATMTLRLLDSAGREELIRFPGAAADVRKRAPSLPAGSTHAKPGDDLNELAKRFGTITLAPGTYRLTRPLTLTTPVRIVGEAGAVLEFAQGPDQPAWTTAIKIHRGGTTLEGFAVRFAGVTRWVNDVSFGPSIVGTTDNLDATDKLPPDPRAAITIRRLDLEGPPQGGPWEEAVRAIRVVSASSGLIERNTIKAGSVLFSGGPWTIVDNVSTGTPVNTFKYEVFTGRSTHDLVLARNRARDLPPSGKTWRLLVLSQRGVNDRIQDNLAEGVGARDDDKTQHANTPEVVLTEGYRLHFEGKPRAISTDGRTVTIPAPQGGPAGTGAVVALLSGPQAGQWRTVAQAVGSRTYLLDAPIPRETDAISIATGFVGERFEGNTIDCRGSTLADNLVLAGNLFGVQLRNNKLLGGREALRLESTPTEEPVHWGWSHAPVLGAVIEGNLIEDSARWGVLGVEHSKHIKANKDRVYMTAELLDNRLRRTSQGRDRLARASSPERLRVGYPGGHDLGEFLLKEQGTRVEGLAPESMPWIHAATVNGRPTREAPLKAASESAGRRSPAGLR